MAEFAGGQSEGVSREEGWEVGAVLDPQTSFILKLEIRESKRGLTVFLSISQSVSEPVEKGRSFSVRRGENNLNKR